jgi:hypothetical protein
MGPGVNPVLADGVVVGALRAAPVRSSAIAFVEGREWVYERAGSDYLARWAQDAEGVARFQAHRTSWWRGAYALNLEGTSVDCREVSFVDGNRRYSVGDRVIAQSGVQDKRLVIHGATDVTPSQAVFLMWLEVVLRRHGNTFVGF